MGLNGFTTRARNKNVIFVESPEASYNHCGYDNQDFCCWSQSWVIMDVSVSDMVQITALKLNAQAQTLQLDFPFLSDVSERCVIIPRPHPVGIWKPNTALEVFFKAQWWFSFPHTINRLCVFCVLVCVRVHVCVCVCASACIWMNLSSQKKKEFECKWDSKWKLLAAFPCISVQKNWKILDISCDPH